MYKNQGTRYKAQGRIKAQGLRKQDKVQEGSTKDSRYGRSKCAVVAYE